MKVTIKIPLTEKGKYAEIEAHGTPKEVAQFLKKCFMGKLTSLDKNPLTT